MSPLERRALLALVSLMRDREPDHLPLDNGDAQHCYVPLRDLYDQMYVLQPEKSYELQRKHQRQAIRRALGRMHRDGLVEALALGWCLVRGAEWIGWAGGGRETHRGSDYAWRYGEKTPNWKAVSLSETGIKLAMALESGIDP